MRTIVLAAALIASGSFAYAEDSARVDLNRSGVLEQLKHDHPGRYQAISAILRASERFPCRASELQVLKTRYDVRDLECGFEILTSYPAKRQVSFELDGTAYRATVTLRDTDARIQPANEAVATPQSDAH
jgi:hypothetical protein